MKKNKINFNKEKEIKWFNDEVKMISNKILSWLDEESCLKKIEEKKFVIDERLGEPYKSVKYDYTLKKGEKFSITPYGIWIIGAKGKIEIKYKMNKNISLFYLINNDVIKDGWYFLDKNSGNVDCLTKKMFFRNVLGKDSKQDKMGAK